MIRDQHIPIMTNEILSFINRKKNLSVLDCTFGGGGHSKRFLENGHNVTAIDQDDNSKIIAKNFKKIFSNFSFYKSEDFQLNGDFVESQAFGYLAIRSLLSLPISFPLTTGCSAPCSGGEIIEF